MEANLGNVFTDMAPYVFQIPQLHTIPQWVKKTLEFSQIHPSEKLQMRILLIKVDCHLHESPRLKSKFQENGLRRMRLGVRQTLSWTIKLGLRLPKSFPRQEVPTARVGLVCFLRVARESPSPKPRRTRSRVNHSGLSKHKAPCSIPITRVMINERLDHLISHVIKL